MDKNLLNNTAQRLNIYNESVIKKAEEFLRLYQTKASVKCLNDQTRTVLCLDLASHILGTTFQKDVAITLSGFKKTAYNNSLNTLEKILGLDRVLTISDACVQLGCPDVKGHAETILLQYKKLDNHLKDLDHPQYIVAAVYWACKLNKVSIDKQKAVTLSKLKSTQWKELMSSFEKLGVTEKDWKKRVQETVTNDQMDIDDSDLLKQDDTEEVVEDYDLWEKRILAAAYAELNAQKHN